MNWLLRFDAWVERLFVPRAKVGDVKTAPATARPKCRPEPLASTSNDLEDKMLLAIAEAHPFRFDEVKRAYHKVRSYDWTIWLCEFAAARGLALGEAFVEAKRMGVLRQVGGRR